MKILSIDPALTTGIAVYDDGEYEFAVWDFHRIRKNSIGDVFEEFRLRMSAISKLDLVTIEKATPQNSISAEVQNGFLAISQMFAAHLNIPCFGYYPGTIKAFSREYVHRNCSPKDIGEMALMFNRVPARKLYTCMYFYERHGNMPLDHNVADANALLDLCRKEQGIDWDTGIAA